MAGIGFELRKLTLRDDLLGVAQGYAHSATTAAGPWLFTILTLAGVVLVGSVNVAADDMTTFRLIIIYNFTFSLVLSGPFVMVATRVLADSIYARDVRQAPSMMLGYLIILFGVQALPVGAFYLWFVDLDLSLRLVAMFNFFVVSGIWLISTFLTALKDYTTITRSFVIGMGTAFFAAVLLARSYSVTGMLLGFSIGLALIFFALTARVLAEYPYRVTQPFQFGRYFSKYWELALTGLVYNMAIWADKWVMWLSPNRVALGNGMVSYPDYDSAMFLAYLTIVPALATFVLDIETRFFDRYVRFYRDIQKHLIGAVLQGGAKFHRSSGEHFVDCDPPGPTNIRLPGHQFRSTRHFSDRCSRGILPRPVPGNVDFAGLLRSSDNRLEDPSFLSDQQRGVYVRFDAARVPILWVRLFSIRDGHPRRHLRNYRTDPRRTALQDVRSG